MAAQVVTAKFSGNITVAETLSNMLESVVPSTQLLPSISYVNGVSSTSLAINQIFLKGATPVTLAAGASTTYTLTSLTDDLGRSLSMAGGVRYLIIYVTSRTAGDYLTVGAAATNPWTSIFSGTTPALKVFTLAILGVDSTDKYAVTAGSNEQLKIINSGSNSITFKIGILGCLT